MRTLDTRPSVKTSDRRWSVQGLRVVGRGLDGSVSEMREIPIAGPIPDLTPEQERARALELAEALNAAGRLGLTSSQRAVHDAIWAATAEHGLPATSEQEIAEQVGTARSVVSLAVNALIRHGYLLPPASGPKLIRRMRLPQQHERAEAGSAGAGLLAVIGALLVSGLIAGFEHVSVTVVAMVSVAGWGVWEILDRPRIEIEYPQQ